MMRNELILTNSQPSEIATVIDRFKEQGRRSAVVCVTSQTVSVKFLIDAFEQHALPAPRILDSSSALAAAHCYDGFFLAVDEPDVLSSLLVRLADVRGVFVWAPITRHYYKSRPVFVQSVPKSGTHVIFECLKAFGFSEPPSLDLPDFDASLENGVFYNLQHMPISCLSRPYQSFPNFVATLARSVTLFVIRDPRDVTVSLAYYLASQSDYHIAAALFASMSPGERIGRVIAGRYPIPIYLNRHSNLSGNIRQLFEPYLAWWSDAFPNVWRVRYEDIIGPHGGGESETQLQTIWGMQLALHVPGRPEDYNERIFSQKSLTFRKGQIGDYLIDFSQDHHRLFEQEAGDLLSRLGYSGCWKVVRQFSVLIPEKWPSSATIASQLCSEFSSHDGNISSVQVNAIRHDATRPANDIEVRADSITPGTNQRLHLSIEPRVATSGVTVDLVENEVPKNVVLSIDETLSPQAILTTIIEALLELECLKRLADGPPTNTEYRGEIRLAPNKNAFSPFLEEANFAGHNLVRYKGRFYAVPIVTGPLDLASAEERLAEFSSAENLAALREMITRQAVTSEITARLKSLEDSTAERIASLEATMEEGSSRHCRLKRRLTSRPKVYRR
jgi:hypothetical protein